MKLRYFGTAQEPLKTTTAPSYTGNITEWQWQHKGADADGSGNTYAFTYDRLSRLTETDHYTGTATTPVNAFVEKELSYDKNGNIKELKRYSGGSLVDDLGYTYDGNRLISLTENVAAPAGNWDVFERGAQATATYGYDSNGNMTSDQRKGLDFSYNFLNLLSEARNSSTDELITKYTFLADGTKAGAVNGDGSFGLEYAGSLVYRRNAADELTLESTAFGGGRIVVSDTGSGYDYTPNYFLTDHLGSTRVVVDSQGVVERNDFYPFGTRHKTPGASITPNRYRFSGKEEQESLGLHFQDFGARMYDAQIGRWWSLDPMSEKYYPWNPYNYCFNNPIRIVDMDGRDGWDSVNGFVRGVWTNIFFSSKARETYKPTSSADYNKGLQSADATSMMAGAFMIIDGAKNTQAGMAGLTASGGIALAGGEVVAAGTAAASGATALLGAGESALGVYMASNAAKNAEKGYDYGEEGKNSEKSQPKEKSNNQLQKDVETGNAPRGIERFDVGKTPNEQPHVHFKDGSALNKDGTWKHNPTEGSSLTNKQKEYLYGNGWKIPE